MTIKLISVLIAAFCLSPAFGKDTQTDTQKNNSPSQQTLPKNWDNDTRAVYDLLVAQFQHSSADYSGSVDTLVKFAKSQKDNQLYAKAFKALLQTGRYTDAVDLTSEWQKISDNLNKFHVLALTLNNETDLALNEIEEVIKKDNIEDKTAIEKTLFPYVQLLMSHWYKPQITAMLARLNTQHPDSDIINTAYVQQLRWQGDIDSAVTLIDKRLFDDARNIELIQQKSDIYRYSVRLDLAEKVWTDLLADYPNEPLFRFAYAQFLYDRYDFVRAIEELDKADSRDLNESIEMLRMMALVQLEQYAKAEAVFNDQLSNKEDKERFRYALAEQLLQKEQYSLARKYLLPLVDFDTDKNTDWALASAIQIGRTLYATTKDDDLSEGDAWFDKIAEHFRLTPEEKLHESVNALDQAGFGTIAYGRLNRFLDKNPNHEDIRYTRGLLGAEMQMNAAAIADLNVIHAASPDNVDVQNALGYTLLSNDADVETGAKLIEKALFSNPSSPAIVDSMGWVHFHRGEFDQALPYCRYAYGNYLDGEIIGHYILALYRAGKPDVAKKLYQLEIKYPPNVKKINRHVNAILPQLQH